MEGIGEIYIMCTNSHRFSNHKSFPDIEPISNYFVCPRECTSFLFFFDLDSQATLDKAMLTYACSKENIPPSSTTEKFMSHIKCFRSFFTL